MILIIAFRNLLKNLKHTLIVVFLIMVIIALFYFGNTVLNESNTGLRKTYILNYTGDVIIQAKSDTSMSLFGVNNPVIGEFFSIPVLNDHEKIISLVEQQPEVKSVTSQISGPAGCEISGKGFGVLVFGVEAESYFDSFPGIKIESGRFLQPGEKGVMITKNQADKIMEEGYNPVKIGDLALLATESKYSFGNETKYVPVIGIFSYANAGQIPDEIVITDTQTARALNSIVLATNSENISSEMTSDLLIEDMDSIFGDSSSDIVADTNESVSLEDLQDIFNTEEEPTNEDLAEGGWNFVILHLNNGVSDTAVINKLNEQLEPFSATAVDWRTAAGIPALLALLLQYLFYIGLVLIIIAGIIAIISILLITVFQRVKEIGTLRAIGASDGYIRALIFSENIVISIIAGILGVFIGNIIINLVNSMHITISNNLIASMIGQEIVFIHNSAFLSITSILLAAVLGFLASIYPVQIALQVQPVEAVAKG